MKIKHRYPVVWAHIDVEAGIDRNAEVVDR